MNNQTLYLSIAAMTMCQLLAGCSGTQVAPDEAVAICARNVGGSLQGSTVVVPKGEQVLADVTSCLDRYGVNATMDDLYPEKLNVAHGLNYFVDQRSTPEPSLTSFNKKALQHKERK